MAASFSAETATAAAAAAAETTTTMTAAVTPHRQHTVIEIF